MTLQRLIKQAGERRRNKVAIAGAHDSEVLAAVKKAIEAGLSDFLLFGEKEQIEKGLAGLSAETRNHFIQVFDAGSGQLAAEAAVKAVHSGDADVLMKGNVPTAVIMKAVLDKEYGLRTGNVLSHLALFEIPGYKRPVFITDAGMNIAPDLEHKRQIIENAVTVARAIGIQEPKVACLAAVETVNPSMPATTDAAELQAMNEKGKIQNCIIQGPLALDVSISEQAALHKRVGGAVAGQADILHVPTIEVGNVLYKSLVYFAHAKVASIIAGAAAPIVLTSRADSADTKLYSLALAVGASTHK
ncbi:MAG: phosphate butyryltransferase [Bacillus sp. (in: firmicutes)]